MSPTDTFGGLAFYFVTSLGHQCVLAFFALSGFLVGGQALEAILAGRWNLQRYLLRRLNRLWMVLLPALFLTWILDLVGQRLAGPAGYEGVYFGLIASGPQIDSPADHSLTTLLANVAFLQTIVAPVFGSNGPLWSLANEFWYYIIFPLVAYGIAGRKGRTTARALYAVFGLVIAILLPFEMLLLGGIWVAGAAAANFTSRFSQQLISKLWVLLFLGTTAVVLVLNKLWPGRFSDLLSGIAIAAVLPILALLPKFGSVYGRIAGGLGAISYTLYATHFPLLAFVWFVGLAPAKWPLGLDALSLMIAFVTAAIAVATTMWWLFERNTDRFRGLLES
jgi:peptidoglycan/LPS O-acetylase OafA/YrhL